MNWSFKKRSGRSYADAIKVTDAQEEYKIVANTPCDNCKRNDYEKNQGADPHGRYAEGGFFDVLHCECRSCGDKRDFVFDIGELPKFKQIIEFANTEGPGALDRYGQQYNEMMQPVTGTCPRCGTPFKIRPGQALMGVACSHCGATLQIER